MFQRFLCYAVLLVCLSAFRLKGQEQLSGPISAFDFESVSLRDTTRILNLIDSAKRLIAAHPDSAERLLHISLEASRRLTWSNGAMIALTGLGNLAQKHGYYRDAIGYFNLALAFGYTGKHYPYISGIYNNIGNAYSALGVYDSSVRAMYRAIHYAERFSSIVSLSIYYTNLATHLRPEEAIFYFDKAESVLKHENNEYALGQFFVNKAFVFYEKEGVKSGHILEYLQKALVIGNRIGSPVLQHSALFNLGGYYVSLGQYSKALEFLERAQAFHEDGNISLNSKHHTLTLLAKSWSELGKSEEAELLLQDLLRTGEGADPLTTAYIHGTLAYVYEAAGKPYKALRHKDSQMIINRHLSTQEHNRLKNQYEIRYRTAQKNKELAEKELLIVRQHRNIESKNLWIGVIASGAAVLVLLFTGLYRNYRHKQTMQENRIRILQQAHEVDHLKAMMKGEEKERVRLARELHDGIGGMLTAMKMSLGKARSRFPQLSTVPAVGDVMKMLEDTTAEVRKTAHNLMPDVLIKHGLEDALLIYCARISAGGVLQVDVHVHLETEQLDKGVELFLYRIAQELIQNVVKHAHADQAILQIMQKEGRISIVVEDNGTGFDPDEESEGVGLQNLRYRVQALEGLLSVMSAKGRSTTIYIEFEIEKLILADS